MFTHVYPQISFMGDQIGKDMMRSGVGIMTAVYLVIFLRSGTDLRIWGLRQIGMISYSMYLLHGFLLDYPFTTLAMKILNLTGFYRLFGVDPWVSWTWYGWHRMIIYVALCIIVSSISYVLIERPSMRLGKILGKIKMPTFFPAGRQLK